MTTVGVSDRQTALVYPRLIPDGGQTILGRFKPAVTTEERRAFVRGRIALYCKLMLWSFGALVVFINAMYAAYPDTRPALATWVNLMAGIGLSVLFVAFLAARRERDYSDGTLAGIDTAATIIIGTAFALSAVLSQDQLANVYSSFIWASFAIFGRSLVVPSSGTRTAVLTSVGIAPMLVVVFLVDVGVPRPALLGGAVIFSVVVVVLATVGSSVIYGLRQQVREAMQLGQYSLGEKIGEGGMGTVYQAKHALLRRPTAIKLLRSDVATSEALKRFEREVQLTSELNHPNTVAIFDFGHTPDGVFYYAMEYLDGLDLDQLVKGFGPVPPGRVAHILRNAAQALAEAHERGLIHRDIKPSNLFICHRGGVPDTIKVLDFGLVKDVTDEDDEGSIAGTPAYLSPEAIESPEAVGPASDIYALGAVGYFLLTGETVFSGKTIVEVCYHHIHTTPIAPSLRASQDIPEALDALILRCLEKDPAARPSSAREFETQLEALGALDWSPARAEEWWAENRGAVDVIRGRGAAHSKDDSSIAFTMTVDVRRV